MHPKMINLNKLKRDPKIPLEKERNFKLLLNAVNQMGLQVAMDVRFSSTHRLSISRMVKLQLSLNCFNGSSSNTTILLQDILQDKKRIKDFRSPEWSKLMLAILLIGKEPFEKKWNLLKVKCHKAEEVLTQNWFKKMSLKLKSPDQ